jgi:hypothetical protein
MNGIEVINTYPVYSADTMTLFLTISICLATILCIFVGILELKDKRKKDGITLLIFAIVAITASGYGFSKYFNRHIDSYLYNVKISDSVKFNEFMNQYKIKSYDADSNTYYIYKKQLDK